MVIMMKKLNSLIGTKLKHVDMNLKNISFYTECGLVLTLNEDDYEGWIEFAVFDQSYHLSTCYGLEISNIKNERNGFTIEFLLSNNTYRLSSIAVYGISRINHIDVHYDGYEILVHCITHDNREIHSHFFKINNTYKSSQVSNPNSFYSELILKDRILEHPSVRFKLIL